MSCPNCAQPMNLVTADNQNILHCANCGGSFFEENGINRISLDFAIKLSEDKTGNEVSGAEKKCPKDQSILKPVATNSNEFQPISTPIPSNVTLLQCLTCHGVFAYPDDLLNFKKAQNIKIDFLKAWGIPMSSLKAVLVLTFVMVVSSSLIGFGFLQQKSISQTQAQDQLKKIFISSSGRYLFISFRTQTPFRSKIIFFDKTNQTELTKTIADKPTSLHYLTTTDLKLDHQITYQIILIDEKGREIKTEEKKLKMSE